MQTIIIDLENIKTDDEKALQYINTDIIRISDVFKAGVLHGLSLVTAIGENVGDKDNDTTAENS